MSRSFRAFRALLRVDLRLTFRKRAVLFFNYLVPIATFFVLCELLHADRDPSVASRVVTRLLVVGAVANGFFGAGMRAVQEREADILRRFKAAPIGPLPILCASLLSGVVLFVPAAACVLALGRVVYGMPLPESMPALALLIGLGVVAFRAVGLIVASVVSSTQESQIMMQLLYVPMLLLSGVTIPIEALPAWAARASRLLPTAALFSGFKAVFFRGEGLLAMAVPALALSVATAVALFLSVHLFRWEKEERIRPAAKLWVALALAPLVLLGAWQAAGADTRAGAAREADPGAGALTRTVTLAGADAVTGAGAGAVADPGASADAGADAPAGRSGSHPE
jgi:ABC-type polysaccharide/polyol phosphate export permease